MPQSCNPRGRRSAAMAPLMAILLVPLLGMMAFSIDVGYQCVVKAELQDAADAAALAGAEKLQALYVQYNLPNQSQQSQILTQATGTAAGGPADTAKKFAAANAAGGVSVRLLDADISFGFLDAQGSYTSPYAGFPNSITVVARRDNTKNGAVPLFFGPLFNKDSVEMQAKARATIYVGDVSTLQVITGVRAHLLPVALDVNIWKQYYQSGTSPDGQTYAGPNGAPQLQVYPNPRQAPGSFGLLDVGPPANDTPTFRDWIDHGETPNDIKYLLDNGLLPVSAASPEPWKGGPGLKDTLAGDFANVIGQPHLIPLFQPVSTSPYQPTSGNGANATYAVVGFAAVQVTAVSGNGSNLAVYVQPMAVVDPTAVIPSPAPAGTTTSSNYGTSLATFVSAKLTQ